MLPLCSHLTLKRGIFYYRRKLPLPHSGEIAISLRTDHYREAQHLARVADSAFRNFFRSTDLMSDVQTILRQHLVEALAEDRERHLATPYGRPVYANGDQIDDSTSPIDADLDLIGRLLSDAREALATRDARRVTHLVKHYMERHGLDEPSRRELAMGLLKVDVQALEVSERRLIEGAVDDIQVVLAPTSSSSGSIEPSQANGPLLSEVLPGFIDFMMTDGGWRPQTLLQNKNTYWMFEQRCGDLPVLAYKRLHLTQMYDLLRALPAMYGKAACWKGMTPMAIVESTQGEDFARLTMTTMKRHFAALGTLFSYLIKRGEYEGANPAHGFDFPQKGRPSQKRKMWQGEKLRALFASPVWIGCKSKASRGKPGSVIIKDEKYWLPLLGLYHGNRLEEFAQLSRGDVRQEDGIHYLDINDEEDKQVKNVQSKRRVPIHPKLIEMGFLGYVDSTASSPSDALFPNLPLSAMGKRGHSFTQWWTRYRREIGLYEPGLDYHSFRHGVTTKLYEADVMEPIIDELTGHDGQSTSRRVYKKDMPIRKLYDAISKVDWSEVTISAD